jgi:RNA polymerase sigma-70 factor (ECF subfamily)
MLSRAELETLVRTHQAEIYRYVRYLGADRDVAQDLVQETFLAACRATHPVLNADLRQRAAYLRGIARNQFLYWCRQHRRGPYPAAPEELERADLIWNDEFLRKGDGFDYVEALRECLKDLPENARGVLDLRYAQDKSREEMAGLLKMTEDGIKSLLRRVRSALGDCIRKRLGLERAP